jgi:NADPH:quinone reductase-like Zn-dependent oxidoreductase
LAKGASVVHLREGDRVMVSLAALGTWRERMVANAQRLFAMPEADMVQTALLGANPPTALLMLRECVPLQRGDWVMQNAANSSVGVSLIQLAKARGLHTVNVVRRAEQVAPLREFGADVVEVDGPDLAARVARASSGAPIRLGIDAIAGDAVERMAQCMADDGVIVNYGLLSGKPCTIDPSHVVFRGVRLHGFWFSRWQKSASNEAIRALYLELVEMVRQGQHRIPVEATYPLARFREALAHASREGRGGKVVLLPNAKD